VTLRTLSLLLLVLVLAACGQVPAATPTMAPTAAPAPSARADLSGIKTYLLSTGGELSAATGRLAAAGDRYYAMARDAKFDYAALWQSQPDAVKAALLDARAAWAEASPRYERVEGIVAGTPSLAEFDIILDAGSSGAEGGDSVVPFDLTLPDGRVLPKPGNLFGVAESTLWGTFPAYTTTVQADLDGDGASGFGETLPDANVLKGAADALNRSAGELLNAAQAWQPTESDAFTALVVMVPTMSEYFESWKGSRFVAGESSTQRDFVAISRLADIQDILGGLEVVYGQVQPLVAEADAAQSTQIAQRLTSLKEFVAGVYAQEQGGKRFTAEEADTLGAEAQDRATAITGQITQVAAQLSIPVEQ
jgi:hypothetical protein